MKAVKYAFVNSLPVMCGYIFIGIAFGVVLTDAGFNPAFAALMSTFVYAGSMQFVMVPLMATGASIVTMAVTTLFVNVRHVFYGLSFTDSFDAMKSKPYMIYGLTDETYSVLCGLKAKDGGETIKGSWFLITLFDHLYWIVGSVLGALLGSFIPWDLTGIDFSMTALFVVILVEQVRKDTKKAGIAALVGIVVALICLALFGGDNFLLPTMIITVLAVGSMNAFSLSSAKGGKQVEALPDGKRDEAFSEGNQAECSEQDVKKREEVADL